MIYKLQNGGIIKLQTGGIDFNKNWYTQRKKLLGDNAKQYGRNNVFPEFTGMKKGVLPSPLTNKQLDLNLSTDKLAELELKRIFTNLNNVKVYNNDMSSNLGGYYTTLTHTYSLNPKLDNKTKGYVDVHESNHAANLTAQQEAIRQYIDSHKNTYLRKGNTYDDYLDIPDEILSRRQEFVKEWNVDPTSKHELKDIRNLNFWPNKSQSEIIENVTSPKRGANKNFLLRYSPEFIQFLLNDVADNNQRVINPNISRKGGII